MKIGIDLDGVLANFQHGYERVIKEASGRDLFPPVEPPVWDWPQHYGYTGEEVSKGWDLIGQSTNFWRTLPPCEGAEIFLEHLNRHWTSEVYFITDRSKGKDVQWQSAGWLEAYGYTRPSVIVTPRHGVKGKIAKALGLDLFLDDKPENIRQIHSAGTTAILHRKSYNQEATWPDVRVVNSTMEFYERFLQR